MVERAGTLLENFARGALRNRYSGADLADGALVGALVVDHLNHELLERG